MKYVFLNLQKQSPWIIRRIVNGICDKINGLSLGPNIRTHLDFLEAELRQRKWLAGEQFSGADIQVILLVFEILFYMNYYFQASFALEMLMKRSGAKEEDTPNISRFVKEMRERPAYKRAMEKVGKTTITN